MNTKIILTFLTILLGIVMISSCSKAGELEVLKTVYIESGSVVDPKTIVKTNDGGFIIAGRLNEKAWVVKIDGEGNVKWRYMPPPREGVPADRQNYEYESAAVMPDDSVFLCAGVPETEEKNFGSALLLHLDKNGKVISQQYLHPEGFKGGGFGRCMPWQGGLVAVGGTVILNRRPSTPENPGAFDIKPYRWVAMFDDKGKMKWEKVVEKPKGEFSPDYQSQLQNVSDGGFIFTEEKNSFGYTTVVKVKPNGDIEEKKIERELTIALPLNGEKDIQLISRGTANIALVKLNDNLEEVSRFSENTKTPGHADIVYRLADNSFILFGLKVDNHIYDSMIMKLDKNITKEKTIIVDPEDMLSSGVKFGIMKKSDEFIAVRQATKLHNNDPKINPRLGLAIDFVKVN